MKKTMPPELLKRHVEETVAADMIIPLNIEQASQLPNIQKAQHEGYLEYRRHREQMRLDTSKFLEALDGGKSIEEAVAIIQPAGSPSSNNLNTLVRILEYALFLTEDQNRPQDHGAEIKKYAFNELNLQAIETDDGIEFMTNPNTTSVHLSDSYHQKPIPKRGLN